MKKVSQSIRKRIEIYFNSASFKKHCEKVNSEKSYSSKAKETSTLK